MKKKLLFFLLICFATTTFSQIQEEKKIRVCDANTKQPIPFTTIWAKDFKNGTFADSAGYFVINKNFADSIYISSIGYAKQRVALADVTGEVIYLNSQVAELKPILVKQWKVISEVTLGTVEAKKSVIWGSGGYGDEFAQKIVFPDTTKLYKIKTISISAERFDETIPMIIHVYSVGADGSPKEDILSKKIVLTKEYFKKSTKKIVIDVRAENIILNEESCFVGVEWLPIASKGQKLPTTALILTQDIPERITYTRAFFYSKDKWVRTPIMPGQSAPNNTVISILVDIME